MEAVDTAFLQAKLQEHFGFEGFRAGQEEAIRLLLEGHAVLAMFPTGGGKSICYQLPALLLEGITVVVSPLVALMKDQVDSLQRRGISSVRLDSSLSEEEVQEVWRDLESGTTKLLYLSPERFANQQFVRQLSKLPLAMLAVDEAHCLSEWGHNFRPDYLRLPKIARKLGIKRVLALTATATPRVVSDIRQEFRIRKADVVKTSFHRPFLSLHITPVASSERQQLLIERLTEEKFPGIVYVTRQETAETVAALLKRSGMRARPYHGGLADEVRREVQDAFMAGESDVVVATIAFGMGIDKSNIRSVFHYNLPRTLENYQQEVGRAGRDGGAAYCEVLACGDDLPVLRNFIFGDTPDEATLRLVTDHFFRQGGEIEVSRFDLSRSVDLKLAVLDTMIAYFEKEGLIQAVDSHATACRVAFNQSEERILAGHTPAKRRQLSRLFASGEKGWKWLKLDLASSAEALKLKPEKVVLLLEELVETGDVHIKWSGIRHRFKVISREAIRPADVAARLKEMFHGREAQELERLTQVVGLAESSRCITRMLLAYFGEKMAQDCGHCGRCLSSSRARSRALPKTRTPPISMDDLEVIRNLRKERLPALQTPRQMARFLCGMQSPAVFRDRLYRHDAYGLLKETPFDEVLTVCGV